MRSSAQQEVEQKMSMQLLIPPRSNPTNFHSKPEIIPKIDLYTIGKFKGGEFCPLQQIHQICIHPSFKAVNERDHHEMVNKSVTTNNGETFTLFIEKKWTEKTIVPASLDNVFLGTKVDREQFGNGSEFYIVQSIYMSSSFVIDSIIDSNNYSIEHRHCKGVEQAPITFGYRLKRYKVNYKGEICSSNDIVNKVF